MTKGLNILIVDDEPAVRQCVKFILERTGHEVRTVDGGEAALEALAKLEFDLVITDFSMPGMRGDQLVARIRKQLPTQPIIMATASAEDYMPQLSGIVDALIHKPFSLAELHQAIERVTSAVSQPSFASGVN